MLSSQEQGARHDYYRFFNSSSVTLLLSAIFLAVHWLHLAPALIDVKDITSFTPHEHKNFIGVLLLVYFFSRCIILCEL